jgi:hypothetical protein
MPPQAATTPFAIAGFGFLVVLAAAFFLPQEKLSVQYAQTAEVAPAQVAAAVEVAPQPPAITYIPTPDPLKAIYMSQCVVGTTQFRDLLVRQIDESEINAVVIDIKDYTGKLGFNPLHEELAHAISNSCGAPDMKEFLARLKEKNIYSIARITVFQDPHMTARRPDLAVQSKSSTAPWKDYKGLSFIDVGAKEHWDYIALIAKDAHAVGFDEVNFDYIRFPSDGPMDDTEYVHSAGKSKREALREFFAFLHDELKDTGVKTSIDIFGMTAVSTYDLNIGQIFEYTLPYFDYVAPMVYPSHFPKNWNGYENPNKNVYGVVKTSMDGAVAKAKAFDLVTAYARNASSTPPTTFASASSTPPEIVVATKQLSVPLFIAPEWYTEDSVKKIRTWIQDFDYGGNYDVFEVKQQIQASVDAGVPSYMIWAPSNRYTMGALAPATVVATPTDLPTQEATGL